MKTIGKATLLATATLVFCGLADARAQTIPGRERATYIDRIPLSVSAEPREELAAPNESADKTLPVLVLTETMGDTGYELQAAGAKLYRQKDFDFNTPRAVVYLDVDTFDIESADNKRVLELARLENWSVVIDSFSWNGDAVAKLAAQLSPEAKKLEPIYASLSVNFDAEGAAVSISDIKSVGLEIGLPVDEFQPVEEISEQVFAAKASQRPLGANLLYLAGAAYEPTLPDLFQGDRWGGGGWNVEYQTDKVKLFVRYLGVGGTDCVVSWRGTLNVNDWQTNWANQFRRMKPVHQRVFVPGTEVGEGYLTRYREQAPAVNARLARLGCGWIATTGHSLGGALALLHAYHLKVGDRPLWRVEAYNPARLGNGEFRTAFLREMTGRADVDLYCRTSDLVLRLPAGLKHPGSHGESRHGCTFLAGRFSLNPITDHSWKAWQ